MPEKELHVFSDGTDTVVAYDVQDAIKVWEEYARQERDPAEFDDEFYLEPDGELLSIYCEDEPPDPLPAGAEEYEPGRWRAFRWAWAAQNGRGFLCSTEY